MTEKVDLLFAPDGAFSPAAKALPGAITFTALPFLALPHDPAPHDPAPRDLGPHGFEWKAYDERRVPLLRGVDWLLAQGVDVINLSLGFRRAFDATDPLQLATMRAWELGIVTVVAAGNFGPAPGTLQELALAPWTIAVGATDEHDVVLRGSGRGGAGERGPTLVSSGVDLIEPPMKPGTSFAAPRVTAAVGVLGQALRILAERVHEPDGFDHMRPLHLGFADTGVDPERLQRHAGALTSSIRASGNGAAEVGVDPRQEAWLARVLAWLRERDAVPDFRVSPPLVRHVAELAARPIAGEADDVGAGSLSLDEAFAFLANLTPSRFVRAFSPGLDTTTATSAAGLDAELGPLWDDVGMFVFRDLVWSGCRLSVARVT